MTRWRRPIEVALLTVPLLVAACGSDIPRSAPATATSPIDPRASVLVTVAGNRCTPASALDAALQPSAVVADPRGGFFVAIIDAVHGFVCHVGADGSIQPAVGDGGAGFEGDDDPALDAELYEPSALAIDHDGALLICDRRNNRIRRVDPKTSRISTVAGTGNAGFNGDGRQATDTDLFQPSGVAVAPDGAIIIADSKNHRVRRVAPDGTVSTIVGTGETATGGDGGPPSSATLDTPASVAFDPAGNLFVSDIGASHIRRVSRDGFSIATLPLVTSMPTALAFDEGGDLFVADTGDHRVVRVDAGTGVATPFAGNGLAMFAGDGGLASDASLDYPIGVAVEGDGGVLVADAGNHRVRRVGADSRITTVAGNGHVSLAGDGSRARDAELAQPIGVATGEDGALFIADTQNAVVRKVASDGTITTIAGTGEPGFGGDGGPATSARLQFPTALVATRDGGLLIADSWNHRIRRVSRDGLITTIAGNGHPGTAGDGGPATDAFLDAPGGVAVDGSGVVYIADTENNRVRRVDTAGVVSTVATDLHKPTGLVVDAAGILFVADAGDHRVVAVDLRTNAVTVIAGTGVRGYSGARTPARTTLLNDPSGVALDANGALFVSEAGNCIVRRIEHPLDDHAEAVVVAGWTPAGGTRPNCGFAGEGVNPAGALLHEPRGLAIAADGTIYLADSLNSRVRAFVRP